MFRKTECEYDAYIALLKPRLALFPHICCLPTHLRAEAPQVGDRWADLIKSQLWFVLVSLLAAAAAAAKSLQSCPSLWDPTDGSPPGSPVPGILQARTLEWVPISFSNAWKWKVKVKWLSGVQLFTTPWSLPGSSIHGIFQARVLEWGAITFSKYLFLHLINSTYFITIPTPSPN